LDRLIATIEAALAPLGFRRHRRAGMADLGVVAFWRRCTWNTNRAVAVVRRPEGDFDVRTFCRRIKWRLLWRTRFIPFLYEVGLQVIVVGDGLEEVIDDPRRLRGVVDMASNQFVVLQSVFVMDESAKRYSCARTWGQIITGQFQDAIANGIEAAGFKASEPA
jgi:hypothetical protein